MGRIALKLSKEVHGALKNIAFIKGKSMGEIAEPLIIAYLKKNGAVIPKIKPEKGEL